MLSYIPGEVPHEVPDWLWSEVVLTDVAKALRDWHDATMGFEKDGAIWGLVARNPPEVICHNDFAPYNCVFRDGRLVGVIDFDTCAPGPRIWDIAYTAYRFVPLLPEAKFAASLALGEHSPFCRAETMARLEKFLDNYSAGDSSLRYASSTVMATAIERLHALAQWTAEHSRLNGMANLAEHEKMYLRHARWLSEALGTG